VCSNEIKRLHGLADTKTDTKKTTLAEFAITGVYSPITR